MSTVHDLGEKVKGKFEEVEGEMQEKGGQSVKGKMTKLRGKARGKLADLSMDMRARRNAARDAMEDDDVDY